MVPGRPRGAGAGGGSWGGKPVCVLLKPSAGTTGWEQRRERTREQLKKQKEADPSARKMGDGNTEGLKQRTDGVFFVGEKNHCTVWRVGAEVQTLKGQDMELGEKGRWRRRWRQAVRSGKDVEVLPTGLAGELWVRRGRRVSGTGSVAWTQHCRTAPANLLVETATKWAT